MNVKESKHGEQEHKKVHPDKGMCEHEKKHAGQTAAEADCSNTITALRNISIKRTITGMKISILEALNL